MILFSIVSIAIVLLIFLPIRATTISVAILRGAAMKRSHEVLYKTIK